MTVTGLKWTWKIGRRKKTVFYITCIREVLPLSNIKWAAVKHMLITQEEIHFADQVEQRLLLEHKLTRAEGSWMGTEAGGWVWVADRRKNGWMLKKRQND